MRPRLTLAYVTTHYPALSHTFILREVAALRRLGIEIRTVSLRRTAGEHLLSAENREAAQSTFAILPPRPRELLGAHASALLAHPRAYLRTLLDALQLARPGVKGRLWQGFYFAEAIILWRHCRTAGASHIHAHHAAAPADVAMLAAGFGARAHSAPGTWSLTLHGPNELRDVQWFGLAEKVRRADRVVCISDFARSQLMALVEESHWAKMGVVHCGINPADYARTSEPRAGRARLLCVGRLVAEKGHAVLLGALARLVAEGRDIEAVLVGSGPLRVHLQQMADDLGIAERVDFRGPLAQDEVIELYASSTLFCSSSFAEGVPVVLMEAMASGLPVIATAIAGVRELVVDGDTGLLVAPGREDQLASAIATLLGSPDFCLRLASAARRRVEREFNIERSAGQLAELFAAIAPLPADSGAEPSELRAGPGELRAGPGELRAGPGELRAGPGELRAGPRDTHELGVVVEAGVR
jgi:glycosyltransferase involved in cell wall biosynthesis